MRKKLMIPFPGKIRLITFPRCCCHLIPSLHVPPPRLCSEYPAHTVKIFLLHIGKLEGME